MAKVDVGDPARTLALLWREDETGTAPRGPRPGLSVDQVVTSAIAIADAEGLPAATMRRVAQALDVAPMTLYTYVPGKTELLDLMLDRVYAHMPRTELGQAHWRQRAETVARDNYALYQRHPWAATVSASRPPLGPGLMAKYEHELGAFVGLGLDDVEIDAALTFLLTFVQASARAWLAASAARTQSAMTDEQWWARSEPYLARVFDQARYPLAARVGAAAGAAYRGAFSPDHAYEFGLQRVLDGLSVLIDRRVES
ncbi:MAG TPA: TetR/AcrR family transcriptional regulator [Micromonosporaceae bacterium]